MYISLLSPSASSPALAPTPFLLTSSMRTILNYLPKYFIPPCNLTCFLLCLKSLSLYWLLGFPQESNILWNFLGAHSDSSSFTSRYFVPTFPFGHTTSCNLIITVLKTVLQAAYGTWQVLSWLNDRFLH